MSLDLWITAVRPTTVWELNITHNLGRMAREAGLYELLWGADGKLAADLIEPLKAGLARLEADPAHYRQFDPPNGWGDYRGLVQFTKEFLEACSANPDGTVGVCK